MGLYSTIGKAAGTGMIGRAVGAAANLGVMYTTYQTDRAVNVNPGLAFGHAVASSVFMNVFMGPVIAASLAPMVPMINQQVQNQIGTMQRNMIPMTPYNRYEDSPKAQTTRARALQAIQQSRSDATNFSGREASIFAARYR